jgi:glycosyltransferase involved in cell wall biosynthesis
MADRLKVLMSAYACEPGRGSEPEVGWQWAIHMAKLHDVTVVTRANNRGPIERGLSTLPKPHPKFIYFDLADWLQAAKRRGLPVAIYYFLWQRAVVKFITPRLPEFDLIHHVTFNSFRQPGSWRACGKPIVLGPLGGGQICPWRLMGDFGLDLPGELIRSATVKLNWLNPFARCSFRDATLILSANEDTANRVPKAFRRKVRKLLETGVSEAVSRPPDTVSKVANGSGLIWVSRLVAIKGAPLILRAFALALNQRPDLHLTLVGDGTDMKKARKLAAMLGIEDNVTWAGGVPLKDVKTLLSQNDMFLFTSLRDTSGNVLLEAMAAGLPAVTLQHHGAAMIATDETALRIPVTSGPETAARLAHAILQLASDATTRSRMGAAAASRIVEHYLWPRKAENMSLLYEEALRPVGPRP